jgi:benzoyl-CoA 2,3-dioxygenase component B
VDALMQPVTEPGVMADWISPPSRGINGQPIDFAYVKFAS